MCCAFEDRHKEQLSRLHQHLYVPPNRFFEAKEWVYNNDGADELSPYFGCEGPTRSDCGNDAKNKMTENFLPSST